MYSFIYLFDYLFIIDAVEISISKYISTGKTVHTTIWANTEILHNPFLKVIHIVFGSSIDK